MVGEPLGAEHVGPLVEGQVGGHQDGAPLVALAEDLEEELRPGAGRGGEAQFVDDQLADAGQLPPQVEQRYLIPGFQRSALPRFHRRDASRGSPAKEAALGLLCGYDHLERVRWNFAQSVLVDVDALDDVAVLGWEVGAFGHGGDRSEPLELAEVAAKIAAGPGAGVSNGVISELKRRGWTKTTGNSNRGRDLRGKNFWWPPANGQIQNVRMSEMSEGCSRETRCEMRGMNTGSEADNGEDKPRTTPSLETSCHPLTPGLTFPQKLYHRQ